MRHVLQRIMTEALGVLSIVLLTAPAFAQNDVCFDPATRQVDTRGTETFRQMARRTDPAIARQLAGVWYAEIPSPQVNMISYQYHEYSADGLFQYQDRVCGGLVNSCSEYQGHGLYAVIDLGGGSLQFMTIINDLNRDHLCMGYTLSLLDNDTMQASSGLVWRRVR